MATRSWWIGGVGLCAAALGWLLTGGSTEQASSQGSANPVSLLTSSDGRAYARVEPGSSPVFPRDHGSHPEYRQEWWYVTANLANEEGRRFGIQLTFFRFAHAADEAYADSAWNHDQTWMAHFALSDLDAGRHVAFQDYARGTLGLAGARSDPFAVWVNGWSARGHATGREFQATLEASTEAAAISLNVEALRPPLLQGDNGFSRKQADGDVASWYYSIPGMATSGTIRLGDVEYRVEGEAWLDHEWSTEVLSREQSGWDWFALALDDEAHLMVFQVRDTRGDPYRYAILVPGDGEPVRIEQGIVMSPGRRWTSPETGSRYPVEWSLEIAALELGLEVGAAFDAQELTLDFGYWEGVVDVSGTYAGEVISGQGYLEMTGY